MKRETANFKPKNREKTKVFFQEIRRVFNAIFLPSRLIFSKLALVFCVCEYEGGEGDNILEIESR